MVDTESGLLKVAELSRPWALRTELLLMISIISLSLNFTVPLSRLSSYPQISRRNWLKSNWVMLVQFPLTTLATLMKLLITGGRTSRMLTVPLGLQRKFGQFLKQMALIFLILRSSHVSLESLQLGYLQAMNTLVFMMSQSMMAHIMNGPTGLKTSLSQLYELQFN